MPASGSASSSTARTARSLVVFNGFYIGRHSGGYDPCRFDVTDFVNAGEPNRLLVRVNATESDGWFYEGAGIYRHVWLVKTHPVHVRRWGTFVRAEIRADDATLSILTEVENAGRATANVRISSTILDPSGSAVGTDVAAAAAIEAGGARDYRQRVVVQRPKLWSLAERHLYTLVTEVQVGEETLDRHETPFGIRSVAFDAKRGFLLNGTPIKLKGTCNHQDHAGIGAALPDAVQAYRVRRLREMGCNALRTSHNPPTPELLDACDRLGMLVFDETRMMSSNPGVLASSPGLASASATIAGTQATLRPQVAAWERPIPKGAGITGLWRAVPDPASAMLAGFLGSPKVFTLTQVGGTLSGTVEGPGGFFGGEDRPLPIVEGTVAGDRVTFKSGVNAFTGTIKDERIELQRSITVPFTMPAPQAPDPNRPAIGPAPDGSDPSIDFAGLAGGLPVVVLERALR